MIFSRNEKSVARDSFALFCWMAVFSMMIQLACAEDKVVDPKALAVKPGRALEFPKVKLEKVALLYQQFTGKSIHMVPSFAEKEIFFYQPGPLTNQKAAQLLKCRLGMAGYDLVPEVGEKNALRLTKAESRNYEQAHREVARNLEKLVLHNAKGMAVDATSRIEYPHASGLDLAELCGNYTGQRVLVSMMAQRASFFYSQAGPLTNAEAFKLLWNSIQIEGFGLIPAEGLENVLMLVPVDLEKAQANIARKRKKKRARVRYVPKSKEE